MADLLYEDCREHKIGVLVCDDHELIRRALRTVINGEPDMAVIGEASDGEQAVALVNDLRPGAVVMDIEMPRVSGIEATKLIKKAHPDATILVLTVHDSSEYVLRILEAGATAYLTKGIISRDIPNAIRAAMNGESILSEEILRKLVDYALKFPSADGLEQMDKCLTWRERELIKLASAGCSNKTIASTLNLSENTVKKYMMTIFDKLGVHSRTAAVVAAQHIGLPDSKPCSSGPGAE